MASHATPPPAPAASASCGCCSGQTLAYLLVRLMLGVMLIMSGADKFKSPNPPYDFKFSYWLDTYQGDQVATAGKWRPIAKAVFVNGGFDNEAVYGERGVNFLSYMFKAYACTLPYAMLFVGLSILLGFLNRISLLLGGAIWASLAFGQMTLPDNPTVFMLTTYTAFYVIALALVKYNRFGITRF